MVVFGSLMVSFGTTWKLVQGVVQPRASLKGKCHIKLDSASKQRLATSATSDNRRRARYCCCRFR